MAGSQREELYQIGRASLHPRLRRHGSRVHEHLKASQHPYLELAHTGQPYRARRFPFGGSFTTRGATQRQIAQLPSAPGPDRPATTTMTLPEGTTSTTQLQPSSAHRRGGEHCNADEPGGEFATECVRDPDLRRACRDQGSLCPATAAPFCFVAAREPQHGVPLWPARHPEEKREGGG
jgi:hypothetical protein